MSFVVGDFTTQHWYYKLHLSSVFCHL